MGKALALAVGGVLTAVLNILLADKLKARISWFTQALLDLAVERLPQTQRARFAEEWASHLNDVSGDFAKIAFSRGCVSAAGEMASFLGHRNRGFGRVLKRSLEFFKQLSKRFVHLVSAAVALFLGEDSMLAKGRIVPTVVVFTLLSGLAGFLASYAFPTKYTSQSLILVEGQKVPQSMVQPVVSGDLTARVATLQQQVLSQSRLEPVVQRMYPNKDSQSVGEMIDVIRLNMTVTPITTDLSQIGGAQEKPDAGNAIPGFYVNYSAPSANEAQQICNELTTLMVDENLKSIQAAASGTSDVLNRGLEDAKRNLDEMDAKLAAFKKQYIGELPSDQDNNLKILMGLNSQLEENTQTLNRAQQDKAYSEAILEQQLTAWKSSRSQTNSVTLQKQISDLREQLLQLQARYADDHPDPETGSAGIAELSKKLTDIENSSGGTADSPVEKGATMEPPEITQLRLQLHQYGDLIVAATRDQKRLQQEIANYQGRVSLGPAVEEQYKALTRDYPNAEQTYQNLLAKKAVADLTVQMINQSEGERMFPLNPANLPDAPESPNRWLFAVGGLGSGLGLGVGLVLWTKLRSKVVQVEEEPVNLP